MAFLGHGPAVPVLLVCLHEDAEKEHHTPLPTAVQAYIMMTWKGPAVHKLVAQKVLVTFVKAAEDLDLSPVFTAANPLVSSW